MTPEELALSQACSELVNWVVNHQDDSIPSQLVWTVMQAAREEWGRIEAMDAEYSNHDSEA